MITNKSPKSAAEPAEIILEMSHATFIRICRAAAAAGKNTAEFAADVMARGVRDQGAEQKPKPCAVV